MISIVLVEQDIRNLDEISSLISEQKDLEIRGSGRDSYDAIQLVKKHKPDIVLLDTNEKIKKGSDISCVLKRYSPSTAIVFICRRIEDSLIHEMMKGAITGCLLKDSDLNHLGVILRDIHNGEPYINSHITARVFQILAKYYNDKDHIHQENETVHSNRKSRQNTPADFSKSELKILRCFTQGYSPEEITKKLFLKKGTVRNYICSIMRKAGLSNRTQIVLYAQQNGFDTEL